jgi:hypothetical protein
MNIKLSLTFLVTSILFIFSFSSARAAAPVSKSTSVTVDGFVDEHVTYVLYGDNKVKVSTNCKNGIAVFDEGRVSRLMKPSEATFNTSNTIIISANL